MQASMSFSLRFHAQRLSALACASLACMFLATGCTEVHATAVSTKPTAPSPATAKPVKAPAIDSTANACYARKAASGDIFVWMITSGQAPVAQELGGEWEWDHTTNKCLTSVEMIISTAPTVPGACTQVAYAADNPGYNVDGTPASPLKKVIASVGPAC